ncbi:MAG: ISKra4 family transposase, partial [Gammaproteobacteria bacterium]
RMDITGARWRLTSAEAVLKLRSLHASGDSDTYWNFYKTQELKRNHSSRIENPPLQKAA